jgi:hypothetical protein
MEGKIEIGDLTEMEVDTIVNPANSKGSMGGWPAKHEAAQTMLNIVRNVQCKNPKEIWLGDRSGALAQEFERALEE